MKKEFKEVLKISSNVMLYVASIVLIASLWVENNILGSIVVSMSVIAIILFLLSLEKINVLNIGKEINVYYFIILILLGISRIIASDVLFNIALALFVILILVYVFLIFIKKEGNDGKKGSKKNGKKK